MIKLKNLITERVTSGDIIKIEKAIKKWHPQVRPLDGKIVSIELFDGGKHIGIEFSKWSDENRITVFMTRIMGYKYKTFTFYIHSLDIERLYLRAQKELEGVLRL